MTHLHTLASLGLAVFPIFADVTAAPLWERVIERWGFPGIVALALAWWIRDRQIKEDLWREKRATQDDKFREDSLRRQDELARRVGELSVEISDFILVSEFAQASMRERAQKTIDQHKAAKGG